MQQRWTLNIQNFGKIRSAQVEVAPLVLFVGENNTGKSYLVSMLWGVLAKGRTLFPKEPPATDAYKRCERLLQPGVTQVTPDFEAALVGWFNTLLRSRKNELVQEVFSHSELSIDHLSISDFRRVKPLAIQWDEKDEADNVQWRFSSGKHYVRFPLVSGAGPSDADKYRMIQYLCWNLIMGDLSSPLFPVGAKVNRRVEGETLYLPAARSGFMLTYKALTAELMDAWGGQSVSSAFTLPVVRFLQGLTENRESRSAKLLPIANYIEHDLMGGKVESSEGAINSYSYRPAKANTSLPYHVASSLVGELSPVVIFLRSNIKYKSLIIEEPEAHLHPALQRKLMRALSRVVTAGVPVWCTTHSDTIFQQVNNMIRLEGRKDSAELMARYGYQKDDLLKADQVRAYQFTVGKDGRSEVSALERTNYGFVAPTFNQALLDLSEETMDIME